MTPQEIDGIAAAINRRVAEEGAAIRAEHAQALEQVTRSLAQQTERADRLQRELDAVRQAANAAPLHAAMLDRDGVLHIVQRNGETVRCAVADLQVIMGDAVARGMAEMRAEFGVEVQAAVARALQRLGDAPRWSKTAVYGPGAVVACYVGRTYALRDEVAASMAQEPGDHPDVWERIGSHGLRVMKSRPAELQAGDCFTEGESRFIFDGQSAVLWVPRALKQSEVERYTKAAQALAQSAMDAVHRMRGDLGLH
jgi:hypothetical protein